MSDTRQAATLRIAIFGAAPTPAWLEATARSAPAGLTLALFGRCASVADPESNDAEGNDRAGCYERLADVDANDATGALRAATSRWPGADLILLRAGTALPPYWIERLLRALSEPDVLAAGPLDNCDPARAPLPEGSDSEAPAQTIDMLCYRHGRHQLLDASAVSPLLSAWSGARLRGVASEQITTAAIAAQLSPLRAVLLDHLYVADPARRLSGPPVPVAGVDLPPPSPLGELREQVAAALRSDAAFSTNPAGYPGLDSKPVVLHVLHGWGGGTERFVRDLAGADTERHHLVLVARGDFARRSYGEEIELRDGALSDPPLRRLVLPNPIRSTALAHRAYAAFLYLLTREFGVNQIIVSSLIGHSLDALRTGLPTLVVGHDFYPLWPLLHRDFGDRALAFDAAQLRADLDGSGNAFEFSERGSEFWQALREAYVAAVDNAGAMLVAPSKTMMANLLRLEPRFALLRHAVIGHGLAPWPANSPPLPAPPDRGRLRLVMIGRVRSGKGAELLRAALPGLREHAELFLVGAGSDAEQFFGERGVHVVLNYRRDDLPALLAGIAPDAALLLPTVAETFSYALSELFSLGLPTVATRIGALAERIVDGLDGWLVEPDATAVVATIARLRNDRGALERVRRNLAAMPLRDLAGMAADYRTALPVPAQAIARYPLTLATSDRLLALTRAGELGALRRDFAALHGETRERELELERRTSWAISLERDLVRAQEHVAERDALIGERDAQIGERDARIQDLHALVAERTDWAIAESARLEGELAERTRWAKALDAEVETMRRSASWRLTRPLRYAMRKLRALRVRTGFVLQRVLSVVRRTRGSLASRGPAGTLRRIGDEFRRATPISAPLQVAAPTHDFVPFAIASADAPQVSIVVPVHNKVEYTVACLRSIGEHAGAIAFEVLVVDDASSDATTERVAQIGGVRALRNAVNLGFVGSCNAGAAAARGEFLVFLNNDTVVTAGWLDALLRTFAEEPDAGLVGAKLVYPDGRLQEAGGIVFSDGSGWNYGRFDDPADPRYNFRREADYVSGAAIMLRRELFERLGGFDTRYAPAYYEDTDLAFAVRAAGQKVFYEPRSTVVHFEGVTAGTDTASGMKRFQVVNRDKFLEKWKSVLTAQPAPIQAARMADAAANHRSRGRILIVDAYTPTPDQDSGSLRMVNLMRLLRELNHAVTFLADNRAHAGPYTEALQALGVQVLYHPFVSDPVDWLRENGPTLDAIVLSRHYIAVNYIGPARLYAAQALLIFDTVDLHYLREERAAALDGNSELARHAALTKAQELKVMRSTDVTLVVSTAEQALLSRELPERRIEVLSNVHAVHGCRKPFAARHDLVFIGGFQHPPNIDAACWFVAEVMPLLRADGSGPRLHIIGSKAPASVLALAADDVIVHGYVEDLAPLMDASRLSVAPLRYGAGVKGKINMAMSYGLPVVATPIAVEGMHVEPGVDVMVADSAVEFAAAIRSAYDDETLWQTLSANGLANVREHFSFDAARAALQRILPPARTR